jgi:hypothetical protein
MSVFKQDDSYKNDYFDLIDRNNDKEGNEEILAFLKDRYTRIKDWKVLNSPDKSSHFFLMPKSSQKVCDQFSKQEYNILVNHANPVILYKQKGPTGKSVLREAFYPIQIKLDSNTKELFKNIIIYVYLATHMSDASENEYNEKKEKIETTITEIIENRHKQNEDEKEKIETFINEKEHREGKKGKNKINQKTIKTMSAATNVKTASNVFDIGSLFIGGKSKRNKTQKRKHKRTKKSNKRQRNKRQTRHK